MTTRQQIGTLIGTLFLFVLGCFVLPRCGGTQTDVVKEVSDGAPTIDAEVILWRAAATGQCDSGLRDLAKSVSPKLRAHTADVLGRVDGDRCVSTLRSLLTDDESVVRAHAAAAAALLDPEIAAPLLISNLRQRLAVAATDQERGAMLFALSMIAPPDEALETVIAYLSKNDAAARIAAAQSMAAAVARAPSVDGAVSSACSLLADGDDTVRLLAAATVALAKATVPIACIDALKYMLQSDSSAECRIQAARTVATLGRLERADLTQTLLDEDPRVAAQAFSAMTGDRKTRCDAAAYAASEIAGRSGPIDAADIMRFRASARVALTDCDENSPLKEAATVIRQRLENEPERTAGSEALCLATALSQKDEIAVLACSPENAALGKKILMRRWSRNLQSETVRQGLFEFQKDSDPRAAAEALAILETGPAPLRETAVREALADDRTVVLSKALRVLRDHPELARSLVGASDGDAPSTTPDIFEEIFDRYKGFDHAFLPFQSLAGAVGAASSDRYRPLLVDLMRDTRLPVRVDARAAFKRLKNWELPKGLPALGLSPDAAAALSPLPPKRAFTLVTAFSRGEVKIALDVAAAPISVAGIVRTAKDGYYDGTAVYRAVPGDAVFLGDATGTGLGDAGYFVAAEVSPQPVDRGDMVVDLRTGGFAGRFFIALRRMPELDRVSAVIGRVTDGLALLDRLDEGDMLTSAHIFESAAAPKAEGLHLP